jgi:hypothetical protein
MPADTSGNRPKGRGRPLEAALRAQLPSSPRSRPGNGRGPEAAYLRIAGTEWRNTDVNRESSSAGEGCLGAPGRIGLRGLRFGGGADCPDPRTHGTQSDPSVYEVSTAASLNVFLNTPGAGRSGSSVVAVGPSSPSERGVDTLTRAPTRHPGCPLVPPTPHLFRLQPTRVHGAEHPLLDHLIRPLQERRRDREAEGLGRLEVDVKVKLRRNLHGKLSRLRAFQDQIDVRRGASPHLK